MPSALSPGTLLGGRYRLEDLLDDVEGARFWRATDVVLARSVAVHVVREDDERTPSLLEAARLSATVTDPRLLRVLDADVRDGLAWVINEWGQGQSLDIMVSQRPLPPERAAWLVREVATAIAAAHGKGLAHGRLAPENVMVTESGTARIIGFATDAALQRRLLRSGNYPRITGIEADVVDLAGLLYCALVGRWPGASGSAVARAPRDAEGPLRPRQVRAGVPRSLDLICDRVLAHSDPGRSAHRLAAVLTEYLGEPGSPDLALLSPTPLLLDEPDADPDAAPELDPDPGDQPEQTTPATEITAATLFPLPPAEPVDLDVDDQPWVPEPDTAEPHDGDTATTLPVAADPASADPDHDADAAADADDSDATQHAVIDLDDAAAADLDWHQPSGQEAPPPPDPEPVPDRPLFAPEGTRRTPRGDLPRSATTTWGLTDHAARATQDTGTGAGTLGAEPSWPFGSDPEEERDDWEERTKRPWLRLPVAVLLVVVVIAVVLSFVGFGTKVRDALPGGGTTTSTPTTQPTAGQRVTVRAVGDLDPFGVPPEEDPSGVKAVIDHDPTTAWQTQTYRGRPDLGGLKPGVGVVLDLGSIRQFGSITVGLVGSGTDVAIYAAPTVVRSRPSGIEGLTKVAARNGAGTRVRLVPDRPVRTRYVVVWLTSLPAVAGGFRGGISGVVVRS